MSLTRTQQAIVNDYTAQLAGAAAKPCVRPLDVSSLTLDFVDPMTDQELEDYETLAEEIRILVSDQEYYAARESHLEYLRAIGALPEPATAV